MHFSALIEPKQSIPKSKQLFSNRALFYLIVPLLIEQVLLLLVGMLDTMFVSNAGEAAVSGVSLVNQLNQVFISVFTAMGAGGAVVISQYIGRKDLEKGSQTCSQLVLMCLLVSIAISALMLVFRRPLLGFLYGAVEPDVMEAALTYLFITVLSFPFLALYNGCSAILRALSKTTYTMKVSILMNAINIIGNAVGIFVLHAGVAGVAVPSLISRFIASIILFGICSKTSFDVHILPGQVFCYNHDLMHRIVRIALPGGIENGSLDLLKVVLSSIVALFGTVQIAANGIAQTIWSLSALFSIVMGPVFITVIGRCLGAGDYEAADYYIAKILRLTYIGTFLWAISLIALTPLLLMLYNVTPETKSLVFTLICIHNISIFIFQPRGFAEASVLRAAGDVRYAMMTSIAASVLRVILAYIFGVVYGTGVIGVCAAMICDWALRDLLITIRINSGKWREFQVI